MTAKEYESEDEHTVHHASVNAWLLGDILRSARATLFGLLVLALVDYVATLLAAPAWVGIGTALRLLALELSLTSIALPFLWALLFGLCLSCRAIGYLFRGTGLGHPDSALFVRSSHINGPDPLVPWLWSLLAAMAGYLAISTAATLSFQRLFKEPQLTALVLSLAQLFIFVALFIAGFALRKALTSIASRLHPLLGSLSPFGRLLPAALVLGAIAYPLVRLSLRAMPQLAPLIPWRHMLALAAFTAGVRASTRLWDQLKNKLGPKRPPIVASGRRTLALSLAIALGLIALTFTRLGAEPNTKSIAIAASPTMSRTIDVLRVVTDFDRDGFGSLLGENDCAPFNGKVHPLARDIPDNGVDENCDGRDFLLGTLPRYKQGEKMPVPDAFVRDWNVLLLTVDTVRYDHTSMANYRRDTTPNLKEFAERSANFLFANAPSAGTMASVPAILTSKFFHSGIALEEDVPRGSPPKLKPENLLLPEVFKAEGYRTGAILSHEYFNDWGMEQGVDDYDNSVGKKREPHKVTSSLLTDLAIAWMGKQKRKWFLWVHYLDPHGYYVSHPGETSYGESEEDLYDGELRFTDKHLGRLLDNLARSPHGANTIVVLTSDHGDAFGEHGYINHGQDLHRELLHVPLIFYVPNIEPRSIAGAVSPIDIFPTLADLIGADLGDHNMEGQSLVPQLFYGKDAKDRVVFAETNFPRPLRAAITEDYKLILDLKNNVTRLFHLTKDPLEKKNVATSDKKGLAMMRTDLNEWIERVVYSRDTESNQAIAKLSDHLVDTLPPNAQEASPPLWASDGLLKVEAFELKGAVTPGEKLELSLYFRPKTSLDSELSFQVFAWLEDNETLGDAQSSLAVTGDGMFGTSHWRPTELVRDRFTVPLPTRWRNAPPGSAVHFGLRVRKTRGDAVPAPSGDLREGRGKTQIYHFGSAKLELPIVPPRPLSPTPAIQKLRNIERQGPNLRQPSQ